MVTQFVPTISVWLKALAVIVVAAFVWPRAHGPSLMVTPFLMGMIIVCLLGLVCHPFLPKMPGVWILTSLLAIAMGPQPEPLALMALVAAALTAWIAIGLGHQFEVRQNLMKGVMWVLLAGMAIHAFVAWAQYFDIERALYPLVSQNDSNRPYGNMRQANHLATFCVLGLLAVWWLYRETTVSLKVTLALAFMSFTGLALSASRTGLLELLVFSGFLLMWRKAAKPHELRIFVFAPLWVALLIELLHALSIWLGVGLDNVRGRDLESVAVRFLFWQEAWSLAFMHPVGGVGWGNLGIARLFELPFNPVSTNTNNAHNLVLQLLAETGFATTFLVLAPVAWFLCRRLPWRVVGTNAQWAWMLIAVVGLHSLLEYPLWYMNFLIPTAFAFGVLLAAQPGSRMRDACLPNVFTVATATLLLGASVVSALDYTRVIRAFGEDGRASTDVTKVAALQSTLLFRYYADRALIERVSLTNENASEMLKVTDRLLNPGPNPIVFWVQLEALCRLGQTFQAGETAAIFSEVFPAAHTEFMQINSEPVLRACGLTSPVGK